MRTTIFALLGLTVTFAACGEDDACGEGLEMKDGACVAGTGGSGGSSGKGGSGGTSGTSAGETGNEGGSGGTPVMGTGDFGDECTAHDECGGDTDYCAAQPGAAAYCTASGCDADPDICPTDWTCFNVGQFLPGEPWVCAKPL